MEGESKTELERSSPITSIFGRNTTIPCKFENCGEEFTEIKPYHIHLSQKHNARATICAYKFVAVSPNSERNHRTFTAIHAFLPNRYGSAVLSFCVLNKVDENFLLSAGIVGPIASLKVRWPQTEEGRKWQRKCGVVEQVTMKEMQGLTDSAGFNFWKHLNEHPPSGLGWVFHKIATTLEKTKTAADTLGVTNPCMMLMPV